MSIKSITVMNKHFQYACVQHTRVVSGLRGDDLLQLDFVCLLLCLSPSVELLSSKKYTGWIPEGRIEFAFSYQGINAGFNMKAQAPQPFSWASGVV